MAKNSDSVITSAAVVAGFAAIVALWVPAHGGASLFDLIRDDFGKYAVLLGLPLIGVSALVIEFGRKGTRTWHTLFAVGLGVLWYGSSSNWFNESVSWGALNVSDYVYFGAIALFLVALKTRPSGRE